MEETDSNTLILPAKKKNKEKLKARVKCVENKKLSKSRKRKLKKLADEKEKEKLLSKSLEALEKYTISENAYSLLWSSQNIGQALTLKEKRRRDMQFSKAGLQLPQNDLNAKRRKVESCKMEIENHESPSLQVAANSATLQSVPIERDGAEDTSTSSVPYWGSDHRQGFGGLDPYNLAKGAATEGNYKVNWPAAGILLSHPSSDNDEKTVAEVDKPDDDSGEDSCGCASGIPDPQPLIAPIVVHVSRPKEVEDARKDLPIIMKEQEIMEAINGSIIVFICGETGCGKTTQVPQFLYEAGYGSTKCSMRSGVIGVTQPRRVAVLSTAKRVAYELGLRLGKEVGFQVRHDKKIGENASIKFMTDGILLREVQSDFLLKRYSVLILDEAHERSLNTDILIGMLSRVIKQRVAIYEDQCQRMLGGELIRPEDRIYPLKLILMSATLQIEDFTSGTRIFDRCRLPIEISARQFPVTRHFSKKTELVDYIGEAYRKVLKIHKRLPPGGILVFVTGQREVEYLCRKLRNASKLFGTKSSKVSSENKANEGAVVDQIDGCNMMEINEALDMHTTEKQADQFSCYDEYHDESDNDDSYSSRSSASDSKSDTESDDEDLAEQETSKLDGDTVEFSGENVKPDALKAAFEALTGNTASRSVGIRREISPSLNSSPNISHLSPPKEIREDKGLVYGSLHVLPLYAMLPAAAQLRVFEETKEGERLVVVATNVAETSLTIPGIKYVVDTGREKVKKYNSSNGMESYEIQWISKASAEQRAGRAGRTGPGHCYRLYSSAAFANEFPEYSCPEILKIPVDGVVLLMKSMGISKVANFPFPTPPDATALAEAERCLKALEALDSEGRLTPLGKTMAQYPMSPRHSRLLLLAIQISKKEMSHIRPNLVLGYAIAVAAALSLPNPFLFQFDSSQTKTEGLEQDQGNQDQQNKLLRKQMKECAKRSRAKFSNLKSDALTIAYALQCFEQSENATQFCNENSLHQKTLEEMSKLRKQLLQLVFNQRYCGLQQEFSWTHGTAEDVEHDWRVLSNKNPLSQIEENIVCRAICAGWADRVAKRIRGIVGSAEGDRKVNAVRYQASMVKETVFLRRWSAVAKSAPEFLVYSEMLHTKRPYIHGATSVESEWLVKYAGSLCTYSAPLEDPKPIYDPYNDQVLCCVIPYFGPHLWELPLCKVPIKDVQQRVAVFAYALLDGRVLPCLKSVQKYMSALPGSILRPEALGQKRVGNLLSKLKTRLRTIDSCAKLREAWKENPRHLYSEIRDWFQVGFQSLFAELWETMHHEVLLTPQDRFPDRNRKKKRRHKKSE
ncbi:hypothetical protein Cgig2_020852 [Carnegiea gigantea]|uniref:RNA helicase n=1 Tax=Carnegiea gigantea TaxID=171969 RepID=A0A9Q1KJK7_9CARY|nr:hypothetical protein Cgig2_020852 [Carnegiea gigantea]